MSLYFCCTERRREAVRDPASGLNGIDFLEVRDDPSQAVDERQRTLLVHVLKPLAADALDASNVRIEGGDRVQGIRVVRTEIDGGLGADVLAVEVDRPGDFSTYTLRLVADDDERRAPAGFDRLLSAVDFSFKVNCPSDFDCEQTQACLPAPLTEPAIDYQSKDYASFRALMLDRLSVLVPDWTERNPADLGVALVEVLAYVGDYLSYQQDAVATEAYLGTARRRVSVRRHARLVDYVMHDGCNARVWVHVAVEADDVEVPAGLQLLTRPPGDGPDVEAALRAAPGQSGSDPQVFEVMQPARLHQARNEIRFHTWGEEGCCLPKGATRAALRDPGRRLADLLPGDVLIFEEVRGPRSGQLEDADRTHRHAVRLIDAELVDDPLERDPTAPSQSLPVVEVTWHAEDALPFALCIDDVDDPDRPGERAPVSVARGNIVLADHGRLLPHAEDLGAVPRPRLARATVGAADHCESPDAASSVVPPRYRPRLAEGPITQAAPYDPILVTLAADEARVDLDLGRPPDAVRRELARRNVRPARFEVTVVQTDRVWTIAAVDGGRRIGYVARQESHPDGARIVVYAPPSASASLVSDPRLALPAIMLQSTRLDGDSSTSRGWSARLDLLNSGPAAPDFVVEVEADGSAALRFGDDHFGQRPNADTAFTARYRVGNGSIGNVGAEAIERVLSTDAALQSAVVRNPLPAVGGTDLESMEQVRQYAPSAFRTQERAVTADDYARMAERHPEVQRATATFRWTGSWHTVFVTIDRRGGRPVDAQLKAAVRQHLEPFRMAGHDVEVDGPVFVPLELELSVCVAPGYAASAVRQALLDVLGSGICPDGRRGVFHPDNLTFGQAVYLSPIVAAAQAVEGVDSVHVDAFRRQGQSDDVGLLAGKLTFERLEIPRLDNNPSFPDRGRLRLNLRGGT